MRQVAGSERLAGMASTTGSMQKLVWACRVQPISRRGSCVAASAPAPKVAAATLVRHPRNTQGVSDRSTLPTPAPVPAPSQLQPPEEVASRPRPNMEKATEVIAMVLGGGPGVDLYPLTKSRAEPAVPLLGGYRLVDVPVSNCLNSGLNQVYVLTQYNSTSLNTHLSRAYAGVSGITLGADSGFVEALNATQTPTNKAWFRGTADAVRRFLYYLDEPKHSNCEDVLVMCGDQLYRMDYSQLVNYHRRMDADVTISTTPSDRESASSLGILSVDNRLRVQMFCEKPTDSVLDCEHLATDTGADFGLCPSDAQERPYVASMGLYVFKKRVLIDLLTKQFPEANDFSRQILPFVTDQLKIYALPFKGYWEDVGSIKHLYRATLAMVANKANFELFDKDQLLYTEARCLPPTKILDSHVKGSLVADGCVLRGSLIANSSLGPATYVYPGCQIEDSLLFGAYYFETEAYREVELREGQVPLGIGANTIIKRTIVDKNARIGANCRITNDAGVEFANHEDQGYCIRDGIIVIMRNATIPDNTVI